MQDNTTDTNKPVANPDLVASRDAPPEISDWNREKGARTATDEGVEMTDQHWSVVDFLRDYYCTHGDEPAGPEVAEALDDAFADQGGSVTLQKLFPKGPVAQGSRIAGLPVPTGSIDESFGSVM